MGVLDNVGDISNILAAYEANKAKGNLAQAGAQQNQANAAANIYRTQSAVALNGPTQSAKSAALGDQIANIQPFAWTGGTSQVGNLPVPQSTGGLTPGNFGPATRKAGSDLATLSANRVSDPSFNIPTPPTLDPLPQMSGLDSILGTAGTLGSLAKAAGGPSGGDIGKLIQNIKNAFSGNKGSTNGNTGMPTGDFPSNLDDPFNGQGNTGMPTGDFTHNLDDPLSPETSGRALGPDGQPLPNDSQDGFDWEAWMNEQQNTGNNGGQGDTSQWTGDGWGSW
jgi:hypothetical protein